MPRKKAFVDRPRATRKRRPVEERLKDYNEFYQPATTEQVVAQAGRCMDCGIPFCHSAGCPICNIIPEMNDHVAAGRWKEACDVLHVENNFPEFTGRLCPALCEAACTLGVGFEPIAIREIEWEVVERGWREGHIRPRPPKSRSGLSVAVIGSGPSGLVAAQMLNWAGHAVTVFEADDRIGGFLRYGVPDFKLEKWVIDRRVQLLRDEGIVFETGVMVGDDLSAGYLTSKFDAVCLCSGARAPRDLPVPGRDLKGIHQAATYLKQSNRRQAGDRIAPEAAIDARDKIVLVLGGGNTGADCIGTANRQGARQVHQFEILPKPPVARDIAQPWPEYPNILRTESSHEEGCLRRWAVSTKEFLGQNGHVSALRACDVAWDRDAAGRWQMTEVAGSDFTMPVDLVVLALGFVHPVHGRLLSDLGVELDARGNVKSDGQHLTSVPGVFAAGDVSAGATLIVRAMVAGRRMAGSVNRFLAARLAERR